MSIASVSNWMSWEGGVDLAGFTRSGLPMPNVIVHVARMVHTPVGSAPSGMVLWQPDPAAPPAVMGFISTKLDVARYFGPHIFKGTPFELAPALEAMIEVAVATGSASAKIVVGATTLETSLSALSPAELIHRAPAAMTPFWQQGCEARAGRATLRVNGKDVAITIPPVGLGGGPGAVYAACGVYAR